MRIILRCGGRWYEYEFSSPLEGAYGDFPPSRKMSIEVIENVACGAFQKLF